jgi:CheY-like chemotaxis protein
MVSISTPATLAKPPPLKIKEMMTKMAQTHNSTQLKSTQLNSALTLEKILQQPQVIKFLGDLSVPIRLLIADAQVMVRQALVDALTQEDLHIVAQASNSEEALELTMRRLPDVVMIDSCMPDNDAIFAAREIHRLYPWIAILVLTDSSETELIWRLLATGASDYLPKSTPHAEIIATVRGLYHGVKRKRKEWYYPSHQF